jgi:hypothetical protein
MSSGIVARYLRMLAGSEEEIKPDRMIHRYIRRASGDAGMVLTNEAAVELVRTAARILADEGFAHITPRLLDHELWKLQRKIETPVSPSSANGRLGSREKSHSLKAVNSGHVARTSISLEEFWAFCERGGQTPSGLSFQLDDADRLHIISPRSVSKHYRISKGTVGTYLGKARDAKFRQNHGWFSRVFDMALSQPEALKKPHSKRKHLRSKVSVRAGTS